MAGRQRTTFAKLQKERARQEKQAAKRARRQGLVDPTQPAEPTWGDAYQPVPSTEDEAETPPAAPADDPVTSEG